MKKLLLLLLCSTKIYGLEIVVDQGQETAQPIIIVPFADNDGVAEISMSQVINDDLTLSGKFKPMAENMMPDFPASLEDIDFTRWQNLEASFMLVGKISYADNISKLQVELVNIYQKQRLARYSLNLNNPAAKNIRKIGHKISDLVYEKLTGNRGAFSTRLAYVSVRRDDLGNKTYALEISGIDGKDAVAVLKSPKSIFSPAWAPDGRKISYVSLENDKPQVWVLDLTAGTRIKYADYPGNNSAPAFSPDGTILALSLSKDGNPEIYTSTASGRLRRITNNPAADTEPVWAPDGKSLYFLSDRTGSPQIFQKSLEDGKVNKVSTFGDYNASPDIASDGSKMALLHKTEQGYQIAIQDLQNHTLNIISNSFMDESPSFAPNGEMLVYATTDSGRGVLTVTNIYGTVYRVYSSSYKDVREPAWSPFLD